jgi:hypothetical protein
VPDEMDEIDEWLDSLGGVEALVARGYAVQRGAHRTGELPRHIRNAWVDAPSDYREFLVKLGRFVLDNANRD